MRGLVGHRRNQRHGRCAGADHHHLLARIVEVLRPELRVDGLALERRPPREGRGVALRVVVIARAHVEEVAGELRGLGRLALEVIHRPQRRSGVPARGDDLVAIADLILDPDLLGGVLKIFEDRRAVGDGLGLRPRAERKAQRVHVRVRADAGIAEQVPGAAHLLAPLEQGEGPVRTARLEEVSGANAGNARPDHQHVKVLHVPSALGCPALGRLR